MAVLSTLILGKPVYEGDNKVSVTLAATFQTPIPVSNVKLKVISVATNLPIWIEPKNADATDQFDPTSLSNDKTSSGSHLHFNMSGLNCNEEYTYQIIHENNDVFMAGTVIDPTSKLHTPITFKAPPAQNQANAIHMIVSADQEVIDVAYWTQIDETVTKMFGLKVNQKELTTEIYREIKKRRPDLFVHMSDLIHGEHFVPPSSIKTLEQFRKAIDEDFHQTVRDSLGSILGLRLLDDHDLGKNNVSRKDYEADPRPYNNGINAFNEFFPVPTVPEDGNRGLFYKAQYGDVDLWCLHNRLFQGDNGDVLGEEQFTWLAESMKKSTAKAKFIVTPLPFVMGKNPTEDYRGNAVVWDKILKLAVKWRISGIFSADSHNCSHTKIRVRTGDTEVTIPQFVVGILGGKPQEISRVERKLLPKPLMPLSSDNTTSYDNSTVESYYTAIPKPGGKETISGMSLLPGKKKYRAFKNGKWVGEEVAKCAYGFLDVQIDLTNEKVYTNLYLMRQKQSSKPFLLDAGTYPLKAEMKRLKL